MAERTTVTQTLNIGAETTPGLAVTCDINLQALSIEPSIGQSIEMFRPSGEKFATVQAFDAEWVEATISGQGTYTEIVYPLSSVLDVATITTPSGATNTREWTFDPSPTDLDAPVTFTVEQGDSVRAHRYSYGLFSAFEVTFNRRDGVSLGGSMLGQEISDGVTLNASPTTVDLLPILGGQIDVYIDASAASLGTTQLTRAFDATWRVQNRYGPLWALNSSEGSFTTHVELEPTAQLELMVEADATGMGLLTNARNGDTRWIRIQATGATIEGAFANSFTLDFAGKISSVGQWSDNDGVWAISWTFDAVKDPDWGTGRAFQAVVQNELTGL